MLYRIEEYKNVKKLYKILRSKKLAEFQLDTEYNGDTQHLHSVQIGTDTDQYVIIHNGYNVWLQKILLLPALKIAHNAKADLKILWHSNYDVSNLYCTMVAEMLLNAGKKKRPRMYALDTLVENYCGHTIEEKKEMQLHIAYNGLDNDDTVRYAAGDVKFLSMIYRKQLELLQHHGMASDNPLDIHTVLGLENNCLYPFAMMEARGMRVDRDKWAKIADKVDEEINLISAKVTRYTATLLHSEKLAKQVNWGSWQQKLAVLHLINPTIPNTQKDTLKNYEHEHPMIPLLIQLNGFKKLKSSFTTKFKQLLINTDVIHPSVWQVVSTGRISISDPPMQQIPSKGELATFIRSCFIAPEGHKIVGGDYSSAELRIIAFLSQDPLWLEYLNEGKNLHSELCSKTFDIPLERVKNKFPHNTDITYRDIQKVINFSLAYGAGAKRLASVMRVPVSEAKAIIDKFFAIVPSVKELLTRSARYAKTHRKSLTPVYHRVRFYKKGKVNGGEYAAIGRQGKNAPIQGANADVCKLALAMLYREIKSHSKWSDVYIIGQVHDEILTDCPEDIAEEWKVVMQRIMEEAGAFIVKGIPMIADCQVSDYWKK